MNESPQDQPLRAYPVDRVTAGRKTSLSDDVAVEEPLELRIVSGPWDQRRSRSLVITMRTPGHDRELALGFLLSEGVIDHCDQVASMQHVGPPPVGGDHGNTLEVELRPEVPFTTTQLQRHFLMQSSCGICGQASLDAVRARGIRPRPRELSLTPEQVGQLPGVLRQQQAVFNRTGGLHAAGLLDGRGTMLAVREDVGRHNAVDKVLGSQPQLYGPAPLPGHLLVVSARASFELVQKALRAGLEMLVAVGAPSSLAIDLALEFDLTLIGFAGPDRFNLYAGASRVRLDSDAP